MGPINGLVASLSQLQTGLAAIHRVEEVANLDAEDSSSEANLPEAVRIPVSSGPAQVVFEDVTFRYADDLPYVHHGVSFTSSGRGLTALVGPSGAGKTTVFSLIERLNGAATVARDTGVKASFWEALAGVVAFLPVNIAFLMVLGVGGARV
ncbi:hypothetical protein ADL26_11150, partial [Thermoactinomyces vulgaris]